MVERDGEQILSANRSNFVDVSIISSPPNVRYIKMSESSQPHNGILYECADSQAGNLVTPLQPRGP